MERIDQCFAKAYKAKMLLYKASPAIYPSNRYDNKYWQEAYEAAKELMFLYLSRKLN